MRIAFQSTVVLAMLFMVGRVQGDIVITLSARAPSGQAITGPVAVGTQATVDILLSASGTDNPLSDLRSLVFDVNGTSADLVPIQFTWFLDPTAYGFQAAGLPTPSAASVLLMSQPNLLTLSAAPILVGTLAVTVNGNGTLTVLGDAESGSSATEFSASFVAPRDFSPALGNISGGTLAFTVSNGQEPDPGNGNGNDNVPGNDNDNQNTNTNDNVPDNTNDNGDDNGNDNGNDNEPPANGNTNANNNTNDNSGGNGNDNGAGNENDNVNMGPRVGVRFCGIGMVSPLIGVFLLLSLTRVTGRRR